MAMAKANNAQGGYEYQLVDTPLDTLVCKICQSPSREPYLSLCCGHTFCKSCLDGAKKVTATTDACPICRNEEFVTVPNKQVDRAVKDLQVFCTNKEKGCEWQGELNGIIDHLEKSNGCLFEEVMCSNDCGIKLQRQYLSSHIEDECVRRKVECQYCHDGIEKQYIEGKHKEQCPKYPLNCPNQCVARNIPREDINKHREVCPLEEVACSDCKITLQRKHLANHAKTECPHRKVDCQYCHITEEHQFIEGEHKEQCPKFPLPCPNKCEVGTVLREEVEEHVKVCPLEIVPCQYHAVGCEERMPRKDQNKHNKDKMEEHLSFTAHQFTNVQHKLTQRIQNVENNLKVEVDEVVRKLKETENQLAAATKRFYIMFVVEVFLILLVIIAYHNRENFVQIFLDPQ
ncbi:TNF receptor-associated factor 4-like [Dysidea avara]|uniref:TNF receptor-associated factor 4-like n=1 Tax=Dysidea avara TaxID=196820 RepID=UPI00332ADA39